MKFPHYFQHFPFALTLFAACFALAVWAFATPNGIYFTNDSLHYWEAGKHFFAGEGFVRADGKPYAEWPPLFALMTGMLGERGLWVLQAFVLLGNVMLWGLVAFLFFRENVRATLWFVLLFAFSVPLHLVHTFLWSEGFFLLLLAAINLLFLDFKRYNAAAGYRHFVYFALLLVLLVMQRNVGMFFCDGFVFILLLDKKKRARALFCMPAILLSLAWQYYAITQKESDFIGINNLFKQGYAQVWIDYFLTLGAWIGPRSLWASLVFVVLSVVFLRPLFQRKSSLIFIPALGYLLTMLFLRPGMATDTERFLSVIYPYFLLIFTFGTHEILKRFSTGWRFRILLIFLLLWGGYHAARTGKNLWRWHKRGVEGQALSVLITQPSINEFRTSFPLRTHLSTLPLATRDTRSRKSNC